MEEQVKEAVIIADKKIEKLAKKLAKTFVLTQEEAVELVYKEWDVVEALFERHKKVKEVHRHLVDEISYIFRTA